MGGKVDPRNQGTVMIDALLRRCHELVHNDTVIVRDFRPSLNVPGARLATELPVNGTTLPLCPIGVVTERNERHMHHRHGYSQHYLFDHSCVWTGSCCNMFCVLPHGSGLRGRHRPLPQTTLCVFCPPRLTAVVVATCRLTRTLMLIVT